MILFPLFVDIEQKTFLVVGGGKTAGRKVKQLLKFTDRILIVAKDISFQVPEAVRVIRKAFEPEDVRLADYVIGATDNRKVNEQIAAVCAVKNIPVNIVDIPELCTFVFPSIVKRDSLTIGITTCGKSPAASRYFREIIEEMLPEDVGEIIERMGSIRGSALGKISDQDQRAKFFRELFLEMIEGGILLSEEEINERMEKENNS